MHGIAMLSTAHIHTKGYLDALAKKDNCRLVAVWDDVAERGQKYASQYQAEFIPDLSAVIERADVDGFIICAENTRHLPLLKAAIPAGKPIFCEKPFTTSSAEAAVAMGLIRKHGTIVHMGYFQPFTPATQGVMGMLAAGKCGKITHARFRNAHHAAYGRWFDSADLAWFTDPSLAGGGAFMDMGTHAVHVLRTLLGPVQRVFARIGNACAAYPKVDDNGMAMLEFASGVLGTVEASWVQTGGAGGLEITGSAGTIYNDAKLGMVFVAPKQEPTPVPGGPAKPKQVDRLIAAIEGTVTKQELDDDLLCAADAVAIMEACYKSSRTGLWTDVKPVE